MSEYLSNFGENEFGQTVEHREYLREGDSAAERASAVYISGVCAAKGYNSDGVTYDLYRKWLAGTVTADDGACMFHGRPQAKHDFYYGPQCRRCGAEQTEATK